MQIFQYKVIRSESGWFVRLSQVNDRFFACNQVATEKSDLHAKRLDTVDETVCPVNRNDPKHDFSQDANSIHVPLRLTLWGLK